VFSVEKACEAQHLRCRLISSALPPQRSIDAVTGVGTEILQRHLDATVFSISARLRRVIWNPIEPHHGHATLRPRRRCRVRLSRAIELVEGMDVCSMSPAKAAGSGRKLWSRAAPPMGLKNTRRLPRATPVEFAGFMPRDDFFDRIDCSSYRRFGRRRSPHGGEAYMCSLPVLGSRIAALPNRSARTRAMAVSRPATHGAAEVMTAALEKPSRLMEKTEYLEAAKVRVAPDALRSYLDSIATSQ